MKAFKLVIFSIVALVLSTAQVHADTGDQLSKLFASDGAESDLFGVSVAINDATAIVGAHLDDDNGDFSGSAYLYDISDPNNPQQVSKIHPINGHTTQSRLRVEANTHRCSSLKMSQHPPQKP